MTDLLTAAKRVLAGLESRIDAAPRDAVPVFDGIADLHDAIGRAERDAVAARGKWSLVDDDTKHLRGLWIANPQGSYIARVWTEGLGEQHARQWGESVVRLVNERVGLPRPTAETGDSIPPGIHYVAEHDNFYDAQGQGMGQSFYRKWRDRRSEFPTGAPTP